MSFIDTLLMGVMGVDALAGGGLGAALFQLCMIVSIGMLTAVSNIVAFARGKGDQEEIREVLHSGLLLVVLMSLFFGILLWNASPILLAVGQKSEIVAITEIYLHSVVWSMLPGLGFMLLRGFVLGLGSTRSVLQITVIAAALNYPVSYVLMKGFAGWQGFGVAGIGYGTTLVSVLMLLAFIRDVIKEPKFQMYLLTLSFKFLNRPQLVYTLRLGAPIAISLAMEVGLFSTAAILAGLLGAVPLAAHQIALQCISLAFMIPLGISEATSIHVGQLTGAGHGEQVMKVASISLVISSICSLVTASLFWWLPGFIVHLFMFANTEPEMQRLALEDLGVKLLLVAALFQWVDGVQVVLMGVLRGLKQTLAPTIVSFVGYWCIGFPAAWLMMPSWGVVGIWGGLGVGLTAAAILLTWVLMQTSKKYSPHT